MVNTKVTEIVSKLEYKDKEWNAVVRYHDVPGLKALKDKTQVSLDKVKQNIEPMPVVEPDRFSDLNGGAEVSPAAPEPSEPIVAPTNSSPKPGDIDALKDEIRQKNAAKNATSPENGGNELAPTKNSEGVIK